MNAPPGYVIPTLPVLLLWMEFFSDYKEYEKFKNICFRIYKQRIINEPNTTSSIIEKSLFLCYAY